jgi:Ca2+-transporting ATPase
MAQVIDQVRSLPVLLLLGSAAVSIGTGGLADAVAICGIVVVNAAIGYATERQVDRTIADLMAPSRSDAVVRRDGRKTRIPQEEVVPGDVLLLAPGRYVPADARLVTVDGFTVDEASLTGESAAVLKTTAPLPTARPLADRTNLAFKGTIVTAGTAVGIAVATGSATEIGGIQAMAESAETPQTPSQRQLDGLGRQLALASGGICAGVFGIGMARGYGLLQMLKSSIALAVAAVPEGLPAMAVTTLALGVRDLRGRGVLVRRLPAVETLGSVQTICLDKTGTITENRMAVHEIRTLEGAQRLERGEWVSTRPAGAADAPADGGHDPGHKLLEVSVLCSDARLDRLNGAHVLNGSATESALLDAARRAGIDIAALRRAHPVQDVQYRRAHRNYMTSRHTNGDGGAFVAVKGNPTEVMGLCRRVLTARGARELEEADRQAIQEANDELAGRGERVLGCAYALDPDASATADRGGQLVWLGMVGLIDPVRPGIAEVVARFHAAGIATVMITGDQRATAAAIAQALNLGGNGQVTVVDARELEGGSGTGVGDIIDRTQAFSRVSPAHKLDVVRALQARGHVVCMTGDGVNDSPALKAADIGIAMGRDGTPIARDTAAVVLQNDQLADMVVAIERGRTIYQNVRKAIRFLLSTNLSEILVMFAATAAGQPQPLSAMQLLWINLASDVFPALGLALEPPDRDVMRRPPRDPQEPILRRRDLSRMTGESLVIGGSSLAAYTWALRAYGSGPQAQTVACLSLIVAQLLHAVTCRSERSAFARREKGRRRNRYLDAALFGTFGLQAAVMAVPGLRRFFGFAPLGPLGLAVAVAAGLVPFLVNNLARPGGAELTDGSGRRAGAHTTAP